MSPSHACPLYFYCIQEHLQSFNTRLFFQLPFCNLTWYKYYIKWFTVCICPSIFYLFQCIQPFFMKDPTFSRRITWAIVVKRHCVCLDVFLHDSIYPCILTTDSYMSSCQLNLAFIFSHNRQTEVAKQLVKQRTWSEPKFSNSGFDHEVSLQATWQKSLIISGDLY